MTEKTLYDVVNQIDKATKDLSYFIESEELDVEYLCQQLDHIRDKIMKTLD